MAILAAHTLSFRALFPLSSAISFYIVLVSLKDEFRSYRTNIVIFVAAVATSCCVVCEYCNIFLYFYLCLNIQLFPYANISVFIFLSTIKKMLSLLQKHLCCSSVLQFISIFTLKALRTTEQHSKAKSTIKQKFSRISITLAAVYTDICCRVTSLYLRF